MKRPFALVAVCPAVATPLVPRDRELAVVPEEPARVG